MSEDFLPFAKPYMDDAIIAEVMACLQSGWLTTGPRVKHFEQLLTDYCNGATALSFSSATAALHVALLCLDLQPGDEMITTPLTFVATLNTIVQAGGKPVLVDINPHDNNLDVTKLEAAITPRTKAIMPVHFAGLPVDLAPLYALAEKYQLRVIEDGAHAIGAAYQGKKLGSFGDVVIFSFHPNKNMTTGEGGCLITRDATLAARAARLRFHGIDRDAFNRFSKSGSQDYDVVEAGFKYNMMDIQAAIGLHQLPKLDEFIVQRTQLVKRYYEQLVDCAFLALPKKPAYQHTHAWHLFTPLVQLEKTKLSRHAVMQALKEQEIGTGYHYQAVHLFSFYQQQFGWKKGDFPHAEYVSERIFSLPLFPTLTHEQQDKTIKALLHVMN